MFIPSRQYPPSEEAWQEQEDQRRSVFIVNSLNKVCLGEKKIPFLDLTASIAERASRSHKPFYYEFDDHPTPEGYRTIAEEVATFLIEEGLV